MKRTQQPVPPAYIQEEGYLYIDTEATEPVGSPRKVFGATHLPYLVVCWSSTDRSYYVFSARTIDPKTRKPKWDDQDLLSLQRLMHDHHTLVFHNARYDVRVLANLLPLTTQRIFSLWAVEDTLLLSHLYNSSEPHGLKALGEKYVHIDTSDESDLQEATIASRRQAKRLGLPVSYAIPLDYWMPDWFQSVQNGSPQTDSKNSSSSFRPWEQGLAVTYCLLDVCRTVALHTFYSQAILDPVWNLYAARELPILPLSIQMEDAGVSIRPTTLLSSIRQLKNIRQEHLDVMQQIAPGVNPNSSVQVRKLLYDYYGLSPFGWTKKGEPSTTEADLQSLLASKPRSRNARKFIKALLSYRHVDKALAYLLDYQSAVSPDTGRIHPSFNPVGTRTTRFSSSSPNMQNVKKEADGVVPFPLRQVFGPSQGHYWLCCDYNQIELRIAAHFSQEPVLVDAYAQGADVHQSLADELGISRDFAKTINYGIIYGMNPMRVVMSVPDVPDHLLQDPNLLRKRLPKLFGWIAKTIRQCELQGITTTLAGYPLRVPKDAPYKGVNYKVQGSAGDILKEAMIRCGSVIPNLGGRMIMTIHDELVFEFPTYVPKTKSARTVKHLMEEAALDLGVHVPAEVSYVPYRRAWSDKKPMRL